MNLNDTFAAVQAAGRHLALLPDDRINQILNAVAEAALEQTSYILSENRKDLENVPDEVREKLTFHFVSDVTRAWELTVAGSNKSGHGKNRKKTEKEGKRYFVFSSPCSSAVRLPRRDSRIKRSARNSS